MKRDLTNTQDTATLEARPRLPPKLAVTSKALSFARPPLKGEVIFKSGKVCDKVEHLFTSSQGILLIVGYFVFMLLLTWTTSEAGLRRKSKEDFLVAGRNVGALRGAFSIAVSWIWAPSLFVAAEKAFTEGYVGLFWFVVPNVLCLIFFSFFAVKIREKVHEGYTISAYMRERFSLRVGRIFTFELSGLATCSFAGQLLAGASLISVLTGLSFFWVSIAMALISLSYSFFSGLKASILTNYVQMIFIMAAVFFLAPWIVHNAGGISTVTAGLFGRSGEYTSLFSGAGGSVFLSFGIATTIGLTSGPFGDQTFWQRAFAIKKKDIKKAPDSEYRDGKP